MKRESEVSACVRRSLEEYFKDLDGESPHGVYDMVLASVERPLLESIMTYAKGNQSRAAEILGINRNTLRKKLQQYNIQ